jgi:FtsP/CotA-like multicopper oxidase with cupredoxin domain
MTVCERPRTTAVAAPLNRAAPATVRVDLPGPMIRVRVGDTVELHLKNSASSVLPHSIDLHVLPSSLHLIGEIFDRVYPEGAMGSAVNTNVRTTLVPGGATIVEFEV